MVNDRGNRKEIVGAGIHFSSNSNSLAPTLQFHKDNLRHLSRFPDFFVTKRILSTFLLSSSFLFFLKEKRKETIEVES